MKLSKIIITVVTTVSAATGGFASNKTVAAPPYYYLTGDNNNPCTDYTPDFDCHTEGDIDCTIKDIGPLFGKTLHELPNCTVPLATEVGITW